ncbi:hypothetical protein JL09_g6939 [Pichia kudriavzevii]|uniref:Uncharacterized protein n=1 Tax=Pichia kudriavzevii TaxID=4909 RepID=A0A099NK28_PICKU|nr:hypothetical protein JL09_g6939 [Pichia kudriavzevii]
MKPTEIEKLSGLPYLRDTHNISRMAKNLSNFIRAFSLLSRMVSLTARLENV